MKNRIKDVKNDFFDILKRPEMTVLPGQLAFFFILSLVPTITIISKIASVLSISIDDVASYYNINISSDLMALLTPVSTSGSFKFGIIMMVLVGVYLISNGTNSIIVAANNIYGIRQKTFFKRRLKALLMVFILISLFLFMLIVPVFGNFVLSLIEKITGYNKIYNIINVFKTPLSWFVMFIFIKTLYTIAPDRHISSKTANMGALFTSVGWIISTEVYLFYVSHFGHYSLYYSGLSNIAVLMIWMYILSTIFVIGLAINCKDSD